jgi:DNA-binding transcriptional LysR family regulator
MLGAMPLTHRLIEVFRVVMSTGHLTRAAQILHTSQPTVSRELARLEQVLDMQLFERMRGRLRPTARALALLEEVQRSYVGLERIAATAVSLRDFAQGRLSLACLPALAQALVPAAARRFLQTHPQASLSIHPLETPLLEQALGEQRHDLGLIEHTTAPPATRLEPLLEADEVVVLPQGHALLGRARLGPDDLAGLPFISFPPADPYRQQIDTLFARHGVVRQMALDTGSAVSVCAMVRHGLGVSIINPLTALEMQGHGIELRALSASVRFQVQLVLPELKTPNPLREACRLALHQAAAEVQERLQRLDGTGR